MAKRKTPKPLASLRLISYSEKTKLQSQPQFRTRRKVPAGDWELTIFKCDSSQMSLNEFVTTYYQTDPMNTAFERFEEIGLTTFLDDHCNIYLEQLQPIPSSMNSKKNPRAEFEANDSNWLAEYFEDISFGSFDSLPSKYTNCVLIVNNPILKRMVCYGDDENVYCFELQL